MIPSPSSSPLRPFPLLRRGAVIAGVLGAIAAACSATGAATSQSSSAGGASSAGGGVNASTGQGGAAQTSSSSASSTASAGGASGQSSSSGSGQGGSPCPAGTIVCQGTMQKECDGNGGYTNVKDCAPQVCAPDIGCAACIPGTGSCSGTTSSVCKADGSGYTDTVCDPDQGVTCDANTGQCTGACAPQVLGSSFIGCDYYPTVTANVVSANPFHYAVIVSNTTATPANVKITQGAAVINMSVVAANAVAVIYLPWVSALKDQSSATELVQKGAYRLRSDQPVTVYQYNPLEYTINGAFSYTNDASLLLPVNTWTGNYMVAARQTLSTGLPGFYAVTASQDNTTVVLTPPVNGGGVAPGAGVAANGSGTVVLNQGDVLEVFSGGSNNPGDLTGTGVMADKPVQIIGGHVCTYLPDPVCCCDHIEETMPPIEALSSNYIVTAPLVTNGVSPVNEVVRIVATEDNTTLAYDPPQPGAPASIAVKGTFVEINGSSADFQVTANHKVIVVQYMEGEQAVGSGDPAMSLAVATEQYRSNYLFHAPTNYTANYVNITAPTGSTVTLDGGAVGGFVPIGGTGYSVARVLLSNAGSGTHSISSISPFGISVYGYGEYTSYWYPGGQNLQHI